MRVASSLFPHPPPLITEKRDTVLERQNPISWCDSVIYLYVVTCTSMCRARLLQPSACASTSQALTWTSQYDIPPFSASFHDGACDISSSFSSSSATTSTKKGNERERPPKRRMPNPGKQMMRIDREGGGSPIRSDRDPKHGSILSCLIYSQPRSSVAVITTARRNKSDWDAAEWLSLQGS